ncbi:hypothetical protein WJN01_02965 [Flavobacteriaceae bacterium SZ-1-7]|uniref:hypothetical protein n=1 Tax=Tamlana sedimenti TaxID=3134126 RepID=UPI003120589F
MKKPFFAPLLLLICLSLVAFQCDEEGNMPTFEEEQTELNNLKSEIEALANTSVCNETSECKFIGLGSKPCGGPWSYLIYSTSIDTEQLEQMVANYNQLEAEFNTRWGIVSDCAFASPPSSVNCENNTCIAVY